MTDTRIIESETIVTAPQAHHWAISGKPPIPNNTIFWLIAGVGFGSALTILYDVVAGLLGFTVLTAIGAYSHDSITRDVLTAERTEVTTKYIKPEPVQALTINHAGITKQIPAVRPDLVLGNGYKLTGKQVDWLLTYAEENAGMSKAKFEKFNDFWGNRGSTTDRRRWYDQIVEGMITHDPPLIVAKGNARNFTKEFKGL